MSYRPWTREQMAARIATDIPDGAIVNIGIGMPELVANYLPFDKEILLHSENGILGMGPKPGSNEFDPDLINAGKRPVTLLTGGSFFDHSTSFSMMRGGHIDIAILGAYQVSQSGDLANWSTGAPGSIPSVGGAMDLAVGAKNVFVMMEHLTKDGQSKLVEQCSYPLTGLCCVTRVYTDIAVIDVTSRGFVAREMCEGMTAVYLSSLSKLHIEAR